MHNIACVTLHIKYTITITLNAATPTTMQYYCDITVLFLLDGIEFNWPNFVQVPLQFVQRLDQVS